MKDKYANLETGEILEGIIFNPETHYLRSKEQDNAYKKKKERELKQDYRNFSFGDIDNIGKVTKLLSNLQCSFLIRLQCQIDYNSILLYDNNKHLDKKGMIKMLNLENKKSTFYEFYNTCLKNNIIIEEEGKYKINENYHFKGAIKDRNVFKSFTDMIKRLYEELNNNDFGLVYKMIEYLNFNYNVLCKNPLEKDISKLEYITTQELADILCLSRQQLNGKLRRLKFDDHYVVATVRLGKASKYYINPLIFSRKGTWPSVEEMELFKINKK